MAALRVVCAILAMSVLAESWYLNRYNGDVGQWQSCETHVADGCCSAPRVGNFAPVQLCFDDFNYLFTVNAGSYGQYNLDLTCDGTGSNSCDDWFGECGSANVAPCSSSKFWNEMVEVHSYPNAKVKAPTAVVQAEAANETVKVAAKDPATFGYTLYRTGGSDTQSCSTYGSGFQCCGAGKVGKLNPVTLCFNDANDQFTLNAGSYGQYSFYLSSSGSCSFYGSYSDPKFYSESISVSCHSEKEEAKIAPVVPVAKVAKAETFGYTLYRTGGSDTQSCATYGSGFQCCGAGKVGKLNPVTLCFNDANDQFTLNAGSYGQYSFYLSSSGSCSFYGSYSDPKFYSESISVSCHSEKDEAKAASVAQETVIV